MKRTLAVIWIVLPFVAGIVSFISWAVLQSVNFDTTNVEITVLYIKTFSLIAALVGIATMVIGLIYIWRDKWFAHREIIKEAWKLTKKNIWKFMVWILALFALNMLQQDSPKDSNTVKTSIDIAIIIVNIILSILYMRVDLWIKSMSLDIIEGKKVRRNNIFIWFKKFIRYFLAAIIMWLFIALWAMLFVVPWAIFSLRLSTIQYPYLTILWIFAALLFIISLVILVILGLRLSMVSYIVIEKNIGPWAAIKQSWALTKWRISNLFALNILLGFINILWVLAIFVGLFWTLPLFYLAGAIFYKKLLSHKK